MNRKLSNSWILVPVSFLAGWIITHVVVTLLYPSFGPLCVNGVHFHHLYVGAITMLVAVTVILVQKRASNLMFVALLCVVAIGAGIMFDDLMDHFIVAWDVFSYSCSVD